MSASQVATSRKIKVEDSAPCKMDDGCPGRLKEAPRSCQQFVPYVELRLAIVLLWESWPCAKRCR